MTPEEIGNALKTRRKEYQLRQEEVAEFARVSERFVREAEKGKQTVRLDKLIDVLAAVGLELVATGFPSNSSRLRGEGATGVGFGRFVSKHQFFNFADFLGQCTL